MKLIVAQRLSMIAILSFLISGSLRADFTLFDIGAFNAGFEKIKNNVDQIGQRAEGIKNALEDQSGVLSRVKVVGENIDNIRGYIEREGFDLLLMLGQIGKPTTQIGSYNFAISEAINTMDITTLFFQASELSNTAASLIDGVVQAVRGLGFLSARFLSDATLNALENNARAVRALGSTLFEIPQRSMQMRNITQYTAPPANAQGLINMNEFRKDLLTGLFLNLDKAKRVIDEIKAAVEQIKGKTGGIEPALESFNKSKSELITTLNSMGSSFRGSIAEVSAGLQGFTVQVRSNVKELTRSLAALLSVLNGVVDTGSQPVFILKNLLNVQVVPNLDQLLTAIMARMKEVIDAMTVLQSTL